LIATEGLDRKFMPVQEKVGKNLPVVILDGLVKSRKMGQIRRLRKKFAGKARKD